jgi:hypothetical protein
MAGGDEQSPTGHVLFEFTQVGQQLRVVAIDEATGTEVVLVAPLTATKLQMQQLALAKLKRRLANTNAPPATPRPRGKFA